MNGSVKKYLMKWSVICTICATPSFILALQEGKKPFDPSAMVVGVMIFIALYTLFCCSSWYRKITSWSTVHMALEWGYKFKMVWALIAIPFAFFGIVNNSVLGTMLLFPDFICGMYAISGYSIAYKFFTGASSIRPYDQFVPDFWSTLAITLIEGVLLTVLILLFSLVMFITVKVVVKCKALIFTRDVVKDKT